MPWTTHTIVAQTDDAFTNADVFSDTIKMVSEHVPTSAFISIFIPGVSDTLSVQAQISVDGDNWVNQGTALTASGYYEFPDVRAQYLRFKITGTNSTQNDRDFGSKVTITIAGYVEVNNNHNITKQNNDYVYGNESILVPLYDNKDRLVHLNIIGDSTCDATFPTTFGNFVRQSCTSWFPKRWKGAQFSVNLSDSNYPVCSTVLYHCTTAILRPGQAIDFSSEDENTNPAQNSTVAFKRFMAPPATRYDYLYRNSNNARYHAACRALNKIGRNRIARFNILRGENTTQDIDVNDDAANIQSGSSRNYPCGSSGSGQSAFTGPRALGPRKYFLDEDGNQFFDGDGDYNNYGFGYHLIENSVINYADTDEMIMKTVNSGGTETTMTTCKFEAPAQYEITALDDASNTSLVSWPSAIRTHTGTDNFVYKKYGVYPHTSGRPSENLTQEVGPSQLDKIQNRGSITFLDANTGSSSTRSMFLCDAFYFEHDQDFGLRVGSIARGGQPTTYHTQGVQVGFTNSTTAGAPNASSPAGYSDEALGQRMQLDDCDLFMIYTGLNDTDYRGSDSYGTAGNPDTWVPKIKAVIDRYKRVHKECGRSGSPKFIIVTPWNLRFKESPYPGQSGWDANTTPGLIAGVQAGQTACAERLKEDIVFNAEYSDDVVMFDLWEWQRTNFAIDTSNVITHDGSPAIQNDLATNFNLDGATNGSQDQVHAGYRGMELCLSAIWAGVIRAYNRTKP